MIRLILVRHFGLLFATAGVAFASTLYLVGGLHAVGMVIACCVALMAGDAWDEEARR